MTQKENNEKLSLMDALFRRDRDAVAECMEHLDELSQQDKNISLSLLCCEGITEPVRQLIEAGADINNIDYRGGTPLMCSLAAEKRECAEMLLSLGADPSITLDFEDTHITAIEAALRSDYLDIAEKIADSGKDFCGKSDMAIPLAICIDKGEKKLFLKILPKAKKLDLVNKKTLLMVAMEKYEKDKDSLFFDVLIEDKRVDINFRTPLFGTALEFAVRRHLSEFARRIIAKGADIRSVGKDGVNVMHIAADNGDTQMIQFLMSKGLSVNIRDKEDKTPLMYVTEGDHREAAYFLIKNGAEINTQSRDGMTPLMLAFANKNQVLASWFLKLNAHLYLANSRGWAAFRFAALAGDTSKMDIMLKSGGVNPNKRDDAYVTPIMTAARHGTVETVKKLIESGAEIDSRDERDCTPLMYAASSSRNILNTMLLKGADINAKDKEGFTALSYAVIYEKKENVILLLQKGAKLDVVNSDGETLLHLAARGNSRESLDISRLLLEYGVERNDRDKKGNTPLMIAARNEDKQLVNLLLDNGADPNIPNEEMEYPLIAAIIAGNREIISSLFDKGADSNIMDEEGHTPLMLASVMPEQVQIVDMLVKNKAKVNAQDKEGMTALMYACRALNVDAVSYLVKYGKADLSIKDKEGHVAEEYADLRMSVIEKALRSEDIDENDQKKLKKGGIGFDLSGNDEPKKKKRFFEDRN